MKKPEKKIVIKAIDYNDAAKYIEEKYNFRVRDYFDRFSGKVPYPNDLEYADFWLFLIDHQQINNPCTIYIDSYLLEVAEKDWQQKIINIFIEEFGEDTEYYVYW